MSVLTTLENVSTELHDFTVDGKCSGCGNCCSNYLPVSREEIQNIRRYVKKHKIRQQVRRYPTAKPVLDMICPFRSDTEKKCTIYPVRPEICRNFRCDKPRKNIDAAREKYHGKNEIVNMTAEFFGGGTLLELLAGNLLGTMDAGLAGKDGNFSEDKG